MGSFVKTKLGEGKVVDLDILNNKYIIETKNGEYIELESKVNESSK